MIPTRQLPPEMTPRPPALALLDLMLQGTPLGVTTRLLVTRYPDPVDYRDLYDAHARASRTARSGAAWGPRARERIGANLTNLSRRLAGSGWTVRRRTWYRGTTAHGRAWLEHVGP